MNRQLNLRKGVTGSLWLFYILIVFEILYMISPFALYYYSFYAAPLNFLNSNPVTSVLIQHILPHFTHHNSVIISILNYICWPLIISGVLLFAYSFCQIYWAKFRRKGVVSGKLYTIIRHPQYVSLAMIGLGTTIYWPRFIVFIMFFAMLFLYYFLAKQEERICQEKYGDSYKKYKEKTGMFLPKFIERTFTALPKILPESGYKRLIAFATLFVLYIVIIFFSGLMIRDYSISKLNAYKTDKGVVISVAPIMEDKIKKAVEIFFESEEIRTNSTYSDTKNFLIYVVPEGWSIPELGIKNSSGQNYFTNSETHGNLNNFNENRLIVFITKPLIRTGLNEKEISLKNISGFTPLYEALISIDQNKLLSITERKNKGQWEGVPTPIF